MVNNKEQIKYKIDNKDTQILDILKNHAEFTTRQIAKKTLLPTTTIHHRIKKMRSSGIIKKYTVDLDNHAVGRGLLSYVLISASIPLLKQKHRTQEDIVSDLKKFYFIEKADIVSGGTDIIAIVRASNVNEFNHILLHKIQLIDGIEKTQSLIVIREG